MLLLKSSVQVNLKQEIETDHSVWTLLRLIILRTEIRQNIRCALAFMVTETFWLLLQDIKMSSYAKGLLWPTDFVFLLPAVLFMTFFKNPCGILFPVFLSNGFERLRCWFVNLGLIQWKSDQSFAKFNNHFPSANFWCCFFFPGGSIKMQR
jgi:hypothetical protein